MVEWQKVAKNYKGVLKWHFILEINKQKLWNSNDGA